MSSTTEEFLRTIVRDPTSAEIARFLSTRSGAQMVQLVQAIQEPAAQAALTASLLTAPPAAVGRSSTPEKAKKALNAFVGFRCYYISIPVFKPWPMKMLSNPMGIMWEADPNKPLWSLMTKAWSTIRDQIGKDNAPLHQFFSIICPYLGMPSQETYLECHGWALTIDKEGAPSLSLDTTFQPISVGDAHLSLSVEDIISYCQSMGYAQAYVADPNATSPTFLSQSVVQGPGQTRQVKGASQNANAIHDTRVLARNKRRAKRQTAKNTGVVRTLNAQIADAHIQDNSLQGSALEDKIGDDSDEPNRFYDELAGLLAEEISVHDHHASLVASSASIPTLNGSMIPASIDWGAFRIGANEDATLPLFDPSAH